MVRMLFVIMLLIGLGMETPLHGQQPAPYMPDWIRDGFAQGGTTHEPWIFQVRGNSPGFGQWQREQFDYRLSEEYIKSIAEAGITLYHIFCYKGFGFEAEKAHMDQAAKAAALAHKYGMKVDTYIQWNNMFYETFFAEVPEAETQHWYKIDDTGRPIILEYGEAPYRYQICINDDRYMNYFKEKILRYAVEVVKTDFIHFDNFSMQLPRQVESNQATIAAFRKYLADKYTPEHRVERFGFADVSHMRPPMFGFNKFSKQPTIDELTQLNDPVMQEWCDFRCWTMTSRLAECTAFVRNMNKEVAIEVNCGGLQSGTIWGSGVDHSSLMDYTNAIWAGEGNAPVLWQNGRIDGKFLRYILGRAMGSFICSTTREPQGYAEKLAMNRTLGPVMRDMPKGTAKQYLDFWHAHRELYTNTKGAERVAVLYDYASMAYNLQNSEPFKVINDLQQRQIPYGVVFDRHLELLSQYDVLILANQESLADASIQQISSFVRNGGGVVVTGNTGRYDRWRRLWQHHALSDIFGDIAAPAGNEDSQPASLFQAPRTVKYGSGRAVYLPAIDNMDQLGSAVMQAAGKQLPLTVHSPEWVGVVHDTQTGHEVVHVFNYRADHPVTDLTLELTRLVSNAWAVSPDRDGRLTLQVEQVDGRSIIRVPRLDVYEVVVLE